MPALVRFDFGRRGFSSRPVTLPSFTSTTPNDCGLETSARAITGARTFPWWAIIAASASPETTTSPFTLRKEPVTWDRMHPIAWAVPSRSVCSSYAIERPRPSPSPRLSRIRWPCQPMRTATCVMPAERSASNVCRRNGLPAECPQGRVEPRLDHLAFRRIVRDRSAKDGIPRDFLHHRVEWAGRDHRDETCRGVDAIGAQSGLRKDPRPGGLASEVRSATLQLCGDVNVSDPCTPDGRLRKEIVEDHRCVDGHDEAASDFLTGEEGQERVSSDESSLAVDRDHAIAIAIVGDAQVRTDRADGRREDREILLERLGISAGEVSVRLRVDGDHVASHLPQKEWRNRRSRTACAVDDDAEFRGPQVLEDRLHVLLDQIGPRRDQANVVP